MRTLNSESLGLCEHCSALLSLEDMSGDSLDAEWRCPKCDGVLTHESFGYEIIGQDEKGQDKWGKTRWVTSEKGKPIWTTSQTVLVQIAD